MNTKSTDFILLFKGERGQHVIRSGWSSQEYHLVFNIQFQKGLMDFVSDHSIIKSNEVSVIEMPCLDPKVFSRGLKGEDKSYLKPDPNHFWNHSKNTPTFLFRLASGTVIFLENDSVFKKFLAKSKGLQGLYVLKRESPDSVMWLLKRSAGPGQPI